MYSIVIIINYRTLYSIIIIINYLSSGDFGIDDQLMRDRAIAEIRQLKIRQELQYYYFKNNFYSLFLKYNQMGFVSHFMNTDPNFLSGISDSWLQALKYFKQINTNRKNFLTEQNLFLISVFSVFFILKSSKTREEYTDPWFFFYGSGKIIWSDWIQICNPCFYLLATVVEQFRLYFIMNQAKILFSLGFWERNTKYNFKNSFSRIKKYKIHDVLFEGEGNLIESVVFQKNRHGNVLSVLHQNRSKPFFYLLKY